jgi:hypothetical protein
MKAKYKVRFCFDWYSAYLWAANEAARTDFGYGVDPERYPLSKETIRRGNELCEWYTTALNQDYPPAPGPWRQEECERFNTAARDFLEAIRRDLGPDFEVIDEQKELREDLELDAYLADPDGFLRSRGVTVPEQKTSS